MDICVLNPFFYPYNGGTEKVLLEIYKRLAKRHNVTVISAGFGSFTRDTEEFGIRVIRLKSKYFDIPGLPLPFPVMEGMNRAVENVGADVYHINNRYLYYYRTLNAIKDAGSGLLLTLHNSLPVGIDPFTDFGGLAYDVLWGREIMRRADRLVGITKSVIEVTVPLKLRHKSEVIFNGVDMERFRKRADDERVNKIRSALGGEEILLNVARLTSQKGQIYLMRAFSGIMKQHRKARLVIIGDGPLGRRLKNEAKRLGIESRVDMLKGIDERMLPFYYNSADVFALPSLYEPASMALLEALASEVPTVASKVGGIPEMMKDCGVYSLPKDQDSIQNGIERLLSSKKEAARKAAKGRRLMEKEHDWDRIATAYERALYSASR